MNKFKTMRGMQLVVGGALLMLANLATAQFVWVDAKGIKQFSDMPPPASVPANKILKQPGRMGALPSTDDAAQKPEAAVTAEKTTAERELDYRKRAKEKADADAKAEKMATNQAQRAAACDAARIRSNELASGKRLRANDGSRAILDDNARAQQQATTAQTLSECN